MAVALLLFCSGGCALVYQIAWLREFRLIFGNSTAASGAVLAVFMGGLGVGNALLARRLDEARRPLLWYAGLELLIAISAAISPMLIDLSRSVYVGLGGRSAMGEAGATVVRILLSILVLAIPTIAMGATFPAAAKFVTATGDTDRRWVGLIYGTNALGTVLGAALSTFFLLESLGIRHSLWSACAMNIVIAAVAAMISRRCPPQEVVTRDAVASSEGASEAAGSEAVPAGFVYLAAAVSGFVFFLMEIVWFRLLSPILGGTTFTIGLILSVVLLGIGLGGTLYAATGRLLRPTMGLFALTCAGVALALSLPFAAGDEVALAAARIRGQSDLTFGSLMLGWAQIAALCVLPVALLCGFQFPLLIALLGRGREALGRQIGNAFAWNTIGAIAGSLAGGFGLLGVLGAPGTWIGSTLLMLGLALLACVIAWRTSAARWSSAGCLVLSAAAGACLFAPGPTAVWRHSGIGAGRAEIPSEPAALKDWKRSIQRRTIWATDGGAASVALQDHDGLAFVINGKIDGNALADAGTQIMLGMLGAILHPQPRESLVVGMGTGETAGWLAEVPGMERVDVVELEPAIDEVARRCAPLNHDVLNHPRVRRIYDDAREILLTTPSHYDLIVSEPSNPYRIGIATLFTREFYEGVSRRLAPGGLFVQWLQGYDIDGETVQLVFATLRREFPHIQVWQSKPEDLLLVCSHKPQTYSETFLRERIAAEPFRSAVLQGWRAVDLEGCLSRYVAGGRLLDDVIGAADVPPLNTDNRNSLEYGFARALGRSNPYSVSNIRTRAIELGDHRPPVELDAAEWERVEAYRLISMAMFKGEIVLPPEPTLSLRQVARLLELYWQGNTDALVAEWRSQNRAPLPPTELSMLALAMAREGAPELEAQLESLEALSPTEADGIRAIRAVRQGNREEAASHLAKALRGLRTDPWGFRHVVDLLGGLAVQLAGTDPQLARPLFEAMEEPWAGYLLEDQRKLSRVALARTLVERDPTALVHALEALEPHTPWNEEFLRLRATAYRELDHPLAEQAAEELREFRAGL